MKQRVLTGALLAAATLVLLWIGGVVPAVAAAAMICVGIYEEYRALKTAGHHPVAWPTWAGLAVSLPAALVLGIKVVIPLLMLICLIMLVCVMFRKEPQLEDALMSALPLFTVMLPGMCLLSILQVEPTSVRLALLIMLLAVPCVGDIAAWAVGSRVGGPKLCPAISPNKTVSGSLAGLAGSLLAALAVQAGSLLLCPEAVHSLLPSWLHCVILGVLGGAAGQVGDLCFSMIKRHCGIKDYSDIFPGHGGMLDRLDSILFMAMVMFCYRLMTVL